MMLLVPSIVMLDVAPDRLTVAPEPVTENPVPVSPSVAPVTRLMLLRLPVSVTLIGAWTLRPVSPLLVPLLTVPAILSASVEPEGHTPVSIVAPAPLVAAIDVPLGTTNW